ncbi:LCP family protein [Nocardioides sp. YIM 152315]|uniref:LCP family protein n=1 Tax=Nocardioides sp. YIM 152315 TaxID=3031760 RepID=UPI0023DA3C2D|nr:LCP family protein [Nocardioides sp. YIM 152315]MDF1603462.1 LCP family protein [Nocardioides sp. YIM 152315]
MSLLQDLGGEVEEEAPPRRRRRLRRALIGVVVCLTVLAMVPVGAFLYLEHRLSGNVARIPGVFDGLTDRPERPSGPAGDAVNVLVIGTDRRSGVPTTGSDARASSWIPGAQRSDALMILHIDADRRAASIVSIPRDTWVNVPGYGMNKINAAFSFSGPSLAIQTVEYLTDIRIDHLAVIDWAGFEALIDTVGGIDVTVPETVVDSARDVTWTAGVHHLDGADALDYVGQRYGLPNGDLDRVARQQVVLRTLMQESLHQEMRKDPRMLYDFLATVTRHLSIDDEWSTRDMLKLVVSMRSFHTSRLTYLTMPVAGFGTERGQSVVYADRRAARGLWGAVIADEVDDWAGRHQARLTPSVVS